MALTLKRNGFHSLVQVQGRATRCPAEADARSSILLRMKQSFHFLIFTECTILVN